MKAKAIDERKTFQPVKLEITLESQEELDILFCHFNHSDLNTVLEARGVRPDLIRGELRKLGDQYESQWDFYVAGLKDIKVG